MSRVQVSDDRKEHFSDPIHENCLVKIEREEWPLLRDVFKRNWPYGIYAYNVIQNYIKWTSKNPSIDCSVYCPFDSLETGTIIIETVDNNSSTVYVFTLEESCQTLFKCLLGSSSVIGWWRGPLIFAIHEDHASHVYRALHLMGLHLDFTWLSGYHYLHKDKAMEFELTLPEEIYLSDLRQKDIQTIDSLWPHRYPGSDKFLANTVKLNGGLGLYLKEDGTLVAWILRNQHNGLGVLQTRDEYRRRGYAVLLVKAMAKRMAEEDLMDVHTCIIRSNHASQKLFKNLGFEHVDNIRFQKLKPFAG